MRFRSSSLSIYPSKRKQGDSELKRALRAGIIHAGFPRVLGIFARQICGARVGMFFIKRRRSPNGLLLLLVETGRLELSTSRM